MSFIDNQYVTFQITVKSLGLILLDGIKRISLAFFFFGFVLTFYQSDFIFMALGLIIVISLTTSLKGQIKHFHEIGRISFYPEFILIENENGMEEIPINSLDELNFKYRGYKGRPKILASNRHDGLGNSIQFSGKVGSRKMDIFISNEFKLDIFYRLINHYQKEFQIRVK